MSTANAADDPDSLTQQGEATFRQIHIPKADSCAKGRSFLIRYLEKNEKIRNGTNKISKYFIINYYADPRNKEPAPTPNANLGSD